MGVDPSVSLRCHGEPVGTGLARIMMMKIERIGMFLSLVAHLDWVSSLLLACQLGAQCCHLAPLLWRCKGLGEGNCYFKPEWVWIDLWLRKSSRLAGIGIEERR